MFFRRRRPLEELGTESLNMTPMIDVVFQLLIFFMLTMHFKEVEGKLLSQLPKVHGPRTTDVPPPPLEELRVFVCAEGNLSEHRSNKGRHEQADKSGESCTVAVEGHRIGEVWRSESQGSKAGGNRGVYRSAAALLKELHDRMAGRKFMIILDADSEVPYEHVIGLVNACKEVKVDDIEFVANPRHDRYHGSYEKGQFPRKK